MNDVLVYIFCTNFTKAYTVPFYFDMICHLKNKKCNIASITKMDYALLSTGLYQVCVNSSCLCEEIDLLEHFIK